MFDNISKFEGRLFKQSLAIFQQNRVPNNPQFSRTFSSEHSFLRTV